MYPITMATVATTVTRVSTVTMIATFILLLTALGVSAKRTVANAVASSSMADLLLL